MPCNYKGSYSLIFRQSVSYHNTDKCSCLDNYIGFQCILFRQAFQTDWAHFFYLGIDLRNLSFSVYSLWEYLVVPKRTENFVFVGVSFYSLEVDGWGVVCSSGEAARDPVGVLPSVSSFFSAFNILLCCVSSLLMAAPRLRSISLEVEMPKFVATLTDGVGLVFLPQAFSQFFSKPCQSMYPIARTLLNNSALPSSCRSSSAHMGTLVEGHGVACTD